MNFYLIQKDTLQSLWLIQTPLVQLLYIFVFNVEGEKGIKSSVSRENHLQIWKYCSALHATISTVWCVHRYVVLVSHQKNGKISRAEVSHVSRVGLDVASFSDAHNLEGVGLFYFTVSA